MEETSLGQDEDEGSLFDAYRADGCISSRDQIFFRYQEVVSLIVKRYVQKAERDDLLQVGYIGLLGAIDRFDPARGVKFSTYLNHCVDGEIRHFLRDKAEVVRRPRWVRKLGREIAGFIEAYFQENQRLPALRHISESLNIEEAGVVAILRAKQPGSLDDPSVAASAVRSLRHESFRLPVEDRVVISQAFEKLRDLEKKVVYLFFVADLNQRQISKKLSLSPRGVSRLMQRALKGMRGELERE